MPWRHLTFPSTGQTGIRPLLFLQIALCLCACSKTADQPAPKPSADPMAASTVAASKVVASTAAASKAVSPKPAPAPVASKPKPTEGVAKPAASPANRGRCGVTRYSVLTDLGIGDLQVGRTSASVKRGCAVVRDAIEPMEGIPQRVLRIVIGDDTVRATVVDDLIWRISITSPRFATRDGLRVGSPISRVVTEKGVSMMEGEDGLYVLVPSHCGLSLRFAFPSRAPPGKAWTPGLLERLHGDAVVNKIFVTHCVR
jgi:hypothetical protein